MWDTQNRVQKTRGDMKTKLTVEHPSRLHNNPVQPGTSVEIK